MAKDETPSDNAEQSGEDASPRKKKRLILIIIAVVSLVVIAGVGVAIYALTNKAETEQQADEHAEEEPEEEEEEEEGLPPIYEKLDSFTVNLADQETYLRVELSLKLADPLIQEKIKARMPEVRDTLLRLLSSKTPEELTAPDGKMGLATEVQREINSLIGIKKANEGVQGVLFTDFILQ